MHVEKDIKCRIKLKKHVTDNNLRGKVEIVSPHVLQIKHAFIEVITMKNWKI